MFPNILTTNAYQFIKSRSCETAIFIIDKEYVLCEVRAESSYTVYINAGIQMVRYMYLNNPSPLQSTTPGVLIMQMKLCRKDRRYKVRCNPSATVNF
jgi:hypothetical protein